MAKENDAAYKYIQGLISGGEKKLSKIDILDLFQGIGKALGIHPQKMVMDIYKFTKK